MVNIGGISAIPYLPSVRCGGCSEARLGCAVIVTAVALQRERDCKATVRQALGFKQINTFGWAGERELHRVIHFIERQPSVCRECTWE